MTEVLEQSEKPRMVEAKIDYVAKMDFAPKAFINEGLDPNERAKVGVDLAPRRILIKDGSSSPADTDLDREGFILLHHSSHVTDFEDKAQIKDIYHEEIRALLKELVGADRVEFPYSSGAFRNTDPASSASKGANHPHIDMSEKGAHQALSRLLPDYDKGVRRWAVYNLWRALAPEAPVDYPLAVLDAQSQNPDDYVKVETHFDHIGEMETVVLSYNPDHRWTYFSQMKRDDVLVFKTFDSDPAKNNQAGHVAFRDESCPDGRYRQSFEIRAYVSWFE